MSNITPNRKVPCKNCRYVYELSPHMGFEVFTALKIQVSHLSYDAV